MANDFLQRVGGLSYLPTDSLAVEVNGTLDGLWSAHHGYNNFHNEPPFARILRAYIPDTGIVPASVEVRYVKTILMCKIGNGYGVSHDAQPFYDDLLSRFSDRHYQVVIELISVDRELQSRLQFPSCRVNLRHLAGEVTTRTTNGLVRAAFRLMADSPLDALGNIWLTGEFKRAMNALKRLGA